MASKVELEKALEQAVAQQFCGLFGVMFSNRDPDDGLEKFARGLQKLLDVERNAAEVIASVEEFPAETRGDDDASEK